VQLELFHLFFFVIYQSSETSQLRISEINHPKLVIDDSTYKFCRPRSKISLFVEEDKSFGAEIIINIEYGLTLIIMTEGREDKMLRYMLHYNDCVIIYALRAVSGCWRYVSHFHHT
jgi:hypothetical protein